MTLSDGSVGQASGKVILFGEHAVVYGVPAIAAGLSRGATAEVHFAQEDSFQLEGQELPASHELLSALLALRKKLDCGPLRVKMDLDIPKGSGLGASAAMAMAAARAIRELQERGAASKRPVTNEVLFDAAQLWEKVFHGNPSGVDVAAASFCGALRFEKNKTLVPLSLQSPLHLAVAQAGPPSNTREMVDIVARFRTRNPAQFERNLKAIQAIVDNGTLLMRSGDLQALGKLMDLNQILLSSWMLSTSKIEEACYLAREAGALGAKLTGAGGGGSVIALARDAQEAKFDPIEPILEAWRAAGIPCFSANIEASCGSTSK